MATDASSSSASPSLLYFLTLLLLISQNHATSINITTTIPLSHFPQNPHPDPFHHLNNLATASLKRAHHLKNPQTTTTTTTTTTPLFSHSYGGYSIPLSFGAPPQTLPFIMDTGSDFIWFPCTTRYLCINCSPYLKKNPKIQSFIPKLSSTSKILGCLNPKCGLVHHKPTQLLCPACEQGSKNCSRQICPLYRILYGSGSTTGIPVTETLDLPNRHVLDFVVGCSISSTHQPAAGIAGLGRGPTSLPTQLGLKKFSYCLLSRLFDDTNKSSSMILDGGGDGGAKTNGLRYTPFVKNPVVPGRRAFSVYYYVGLRYITVGQKRVNIPYKYLRPDSSGSYGTIIDSGTTFTIMAREVFERVAGEFERQVVGYKRAREAEVMSGLRPCYNVSNVETAAFPEVTLHFKGGADVALPVENYVAMAGGGVMCLTVMSDDGGAGGPGVPSGPSIILGSFQMQNFYVEYDLQNERLGFRQQRCN